ncbi:conserved Plasmodium protein, unknown function [Plasmodium ovale curtisi]|uniref:Uncharacterized protein n=1 Tax=Plasmodium ovale curtisi TaxID=864141 RepID=A0A1A8W067_PLAOA|nr:conserved Plasmodium protein, unknown function [Plasmodium ovale curtisi]SBS96688.1 conserved Plasmodium protein, unknown function [Plasmodium ovale curtisi]
MNFVENKPDIPFCDNRHNCNPHKCRIKNEAEDSHLNCYGPPHSMSNRLNLEKYYISKNANSNGNLYNHARMHGARHHETQLYFPNDMSIQNGINKTYPYPIFPADFNSNERTLRGSYPNEKVFPKDNSLGNNIKGTDSGRRRKDYCQPPNYDITDNSCKHKNRIKMNYNYDYKSDDGVSSDKDCQSNYENSDTSKKKKGINNTIINVTTDGTSSESDYTEYSEKSIFGLKKKKKKRPRKLFMGKYFFSEIKNSFLPPWNIRTESHPPLVIPRCACVFYGTPGWVKSDGGTTPEIVVRF